MILFISYITSYICNLVEETSSSPIAVFFHIEMNLQLSSLSSCGQCLHRLTEQPRFTCICSFYAVHRGSDKVENEVINAEEVPEEVDAKNISRNSAAVDDGSLHNKSVKIKIELKDIERMIKSFRSHRCALDFDGAFIERESAKM